MHCHLCRAVAGVPARGNRAEPNEALVSIEVLKRSKTLCETTWPKQKRRANKTTRRCAQYWLFTHAYPYPESGRLTDDDLGLDPAPLAGAKYDSKLFESMRRHLKRSTHPQSPFYDRALELFERSAGT